MKLKPLGDRLIVKAVEEEETTASGIVLPDTAKEKPQKGKVLAVGDGKLDDDGKRIPLDVAEGDEVLYSKYGGTEIKVDGDDLLVGGVGHDTLRGGAGDDGFRARDHLRDTVRGASGRDWARVDRHLDRVMGIQYFAS